jgi:hypothetical protein
MSVPDTSVRIDRLTALNGLLAGPNVAGENDYERRGCEREVERDNHANAAGGRVTPRARWWRTSGCVWVASRCRSLQRSAQLPREIIQSIEGFGLQERTLNLRVDGSIPSWLTSIRYMNQRLAISQLPSPSLISNHDFGWVHRVM